MFGGGKNEMLKRKCKKIIKMFNQDKLDFKLEQVKDNFIDENLYCLMSDYSSLKLNKEARKELVRSYESYKKIDAFLIDKAVETIAVNYIKENLFDNKSEKTSDDEDILESAIAKINEKDEYFDNFGKKIEKVV